MGKFIEWQSTYSVNSRKMDLHHRVIVYLINALYEKNHDGHVADVKVAVELLEAYIVDHFAEEERLMEAIEYPEYRQHCEIHRQLLKELRSHSSDYIKNGGRFNEVFFHFLKQWVVTHICGQDTRYGKAFGKHA